MWVLWLTRCGFGGCCLLSVWLLGAVCGVVMFRLLPCTLGLHWFVTWVVYVVDSACGIGMVILIVLIC